MMQTRLKVSVAAAILAALSMYFSSHCAFGILCWQGSLVLISSMILALILTAAYIVLSAGHSPDVSLNGVTFFIGGFFLYYGLIWTVLMTRNVRTIRRKKSFPTKRFIATASFLLTDSIMAIVLITNGDFLYRTGILIDFFIFGIIFLMTAAVMKFAIEAWSKK